MCLVVIPYIPEGGGGGGGGGGGTGEGFRRRLPSGATRPPSVLPRRILHPTVRRSIGPLEYVPMADESNLLPLPTSRIARWLAIGALIAFAVALYFRDGRTVPPLTGAPPTAAPAGQPSN